MTLIGQILCWLAALFAFIACQRKEYKGIVIFNTLSALSIAVGYMLLGRWPGMILNILAILRNFVIMKRGVKFFSYKFWPVIFTVAMGLSGVLTWQGPMSLLVIIALMMNTVFMFMPNPQNLRKSILFTSRLPCTTAIYFSSKHSFIIFSMAVDVSGT